MLAFQWSRGLFASALLAGALLVSACGGHGISPSLPQSATRYAAVIGDTEAAVRQGIRTASKAGMHTAYVDVFAPHRDYVFSAYSQILRSRRAFVVRAYGWLYVFPLTSIRVEFEGKPISLPSIPFIKDPKLDGYTGKSPGKFIAGDLVLKRSICGDCAALLAVSNQHVRAFAEQWLDVSDPWQLAKNFTPFSGGSDRRPLAVATPTCQFCSWSVASTPTPGPTAPPGSLAYYSLGGPQFAYVTPTPGTGGSSGGGGSDSPVPNQTTIEHKIANEALYFYQQRWSTSKGPGQGSVACAYAVNLIFSSAIGHKIGALPNFVPSVEQALKSGGYGSPISQANAVPGDVAIQGQDGHIGICANIGCTSVYSNSTSAHCFCDVSGPTFSGPGWPYPADVAPRFYRVIK